MNKTKLMTDIHIGIMKQVMGNLRRSSHIPSRPFFHVR